MKKIIFFIFLMLFSTGCKEKKNSPFFIPWMMSLTGQNTENSVIEDSNGEILPPTMIEGEQEIPNVGRALISGSVSPMMCVENDISIPCDREPNLSLENVEVFLVSATGETISSTFLNAEGKYEFEIDDLKNNNYRILMKSDMDLNYSHNDFNFTFNPTKENKITVGEIKPIRKYFESGPATIKGKVIVNEFKDDNGNVLITSKPATGFKVSLLDKDNRLLNFNQVNIDKLIDANGEYEFNIDDLKNNNYKIVVTPTNFGYTNFSINEKQIPFRFIYIGNNKNDVTDINLNLTRIDIIGSEDFNVKISNWQIKNVVNELNDFTVELKNNRNDIIDTTKTDMEGKFSFNTKLEKEVYSIEIKKENYATNISNFTFVPNYFSSSTQINQVSPIIMVPNKTTVLSKISGPNGFPRRIEGATINFRPSSNQSPTNLSYFLRTEDERIKGMINLWMKEACVSNTDCFNQCQTVNFSSECVVKNEGPEPWRYSTYQNKIYEVKEDNETVYLTALPGKWEYYISASGYINSTVSNLNLNGSQMNMEAKSLMPSNYRAGINGKVTVLDILGNGEKNSYGDQVVGYNQNQGLTGIFVVMLGNSIDNKALAHVTLTKNGEYNFDENSKVVLLPTLQNLCSNERVIKEIGINNLISLNEETTPKCSAMGDSLKTAYAYLDYKLLDNLGYTSTVNVNDIDGSVYLYKNKYTFKEGIYSLFFIDPLKHFTINNQKAEINKNLIAFGENLNLKNIINHLPRRNLTGNINDAISTLPVSQVAITLGTNLSSDLIAFSPLVYKDADKLSTDKPRLDLNTGERADTQITGIATDNLGNYSFQNINPGNYLLKINKTGFEEIIIKVTVSVTNQNTIVNNQVVENGSKGDLSGRVILAGGQSFLSSYSLELIHPVSGNRPIGVMPVSLSSGSTPFVSTPNYKILNVNSGIWKIRFISSNYVITEGVVNIQKDVVNNYDIITMIKDSEPASDISGIFFNAFDNKKITNELNILIRPGINNKYGELALNSNNQTVNMLKSSADGSYLIPNMPAGNYTLEIWNDNYATTYETVISSGPINSKNQNVFISPKLNNDEMRIVLSWNDFPKDLDSHLEYDNASCINGSHKCQVYWRNTNVVNGDLTLDYDVTAGFGPETISLKNTIWQKPRRGYSVYRWSTEPNYSIYNSGATVKIFKPFGLVKTYHPGPAQSTNRWWQIFCLNNMGAILEIETDGCKIQDFFDSP